jgi:hypothetical protein
MKKKNSTNPHSSIQEKNKGEGRGAAAIYIGRTKGGAHSGRPPHSPLVPVCVANRDERFVTNRDQWMPYAWANLGRRGQAFSPGPNNGRD